MLIGRFEEQGLPVSIELTELSLKVDAEAQKYFLLLTVGCVAFGVVSVGNWSGAASDIKCLHAMVVLLVLFGYLIISMDGTLTLIWSSSLCSSSIYTVIVQ